MTSKKQKEAQTVTIDDVEYKVDDLTQEQVALVNHVADLDRKISSAQFNIDQLNVGRGAFMNMLTESLKAEEVEIAEVA
jgi:septal ring factor EnvC (AmiA/AmiB activator)